MGPGSAELRRTGLLATCVALAVLWTLSSLATDVPFPPSAFAQALVRAAPGEVATFFIELLHHWAVRLLTLGVLAGSLLVGAQALVATASKGAPRPLRAAAVLVTLSALASFGASFGAVNVVATVLALLVTGAIYAYTAGALHGLDHAGPGAPDESRRRALRLGVGGAVAVAAAGGGLGWLIRRLSGPDTDVAIATPRVRARVPERPPFPDVAGLTREVTSVRDHYVVDINLVRPAVEVDGWTLSVRGEVERPLELSFAELQRDFEFVEEYAVLTCVSNEVGGDLIGHSLWGGVRLAEVLEKAGVRPGAVDLVLRAADGYSDSIPAELGRDPGVLLTVAQNRRPLTQDHGFPCRLRVPPIFGMKNVKWLESIEVVGVDHEGYWQQRGWSDDASVRTQSRIDVVGNGFSAARGRPTWIAGVAWAGARGVSRVEVSTDGGETWSDAELRAPIGPLSWRQWAYRWTPEGEGGTTVMCRATDGGGDVQTSATAPPHPSGATGLHSMTVEVT
ncbi:MAG: molybdopterin-dependent oxidoreductase [Actinomycetota bacterium]